MTRRVLLLRGVNVGGHGRLPMAHLRAILGGLGGRGCRTLIQSGNAVLDHEEPDAARLAARVTNAIGAQAGFAPAALVLSVPELSAILDAVPADWPAEASHAWIAAADLAPDAARLDALAAPSERWAASGRALFLHAPDGIGRSKFAARAEAALGVPVTARKVAVLEKLRALAEAD